MSKGGLSGATYTLLLGDALEQLRTLPDASVQTCVTSPPYLGLRDYGVDGQIGLEPTPAEYVAKLVAVFREVKRVLRDDGTFWLNLGDSYVSTAPGTMGDALRQDGILAAVKDDTAEARRKFRPAVPEGLKPKDLMGMPWQVAFALQADSWYLRSDVIEEVELYCPCGCGYVLEERIWRYGQDRDIAWAKENGMPESVLDRPVRAHEYIFLLTKSGKPQFWVHRDRPYADRTFKRPAPDYVWIHRETGEERTEEPSDAEHWRRKNLWRSCDYYYDAAAIREPAKATNWHDATGSGYQAPGQTSQRGNRDKQRGHSRRHAGFNARWDAMPREQQMAFGHAKRDTWHVATQPFPDAHYAVMPEAIAETCILAGCPEGGTVLDPFAGSGTTLAVANRLGRHAIGIELNRDYARLIHDRCRQSGFVFAE